MRTDSQTSRSVQTEQVGEVTVMRLAGHIDELGADAVSAELDRNIEAGNHRIIFDLGEVLFMGSTGLGQIMRAYRAVKSEGGYIKVANPQPLIADLFKLTKLDKLISICPTLEEALQDDS